VIGLSPAETTGLVCFLVGGLIVIVAVKHPSWAVRPSAWGIASADSLPSLVIMVAVTAILKFLRLWTVGLILMLGGIALFIAGWK